MARQSARSTTSGPRSSSSRSTVGTSTAPRVGRVRVTPPTKKK